MGNLSKSIYATKRYVDLSSVRSVELFDISLQKTLDIYFIVVKKIPKKYFVLIACKRCVAMRIDREDLPRSFNDKLDSMILVIWEYSTDKLSLICNGCSAE